MPKPMRVAYLSTFPKLRGQLGYVAVGWGYSDIWPWIRAAPTAPYCSSVQACLLSDCCVEAEGRITEPLSRLALQSRFAQTQVLL